MQLELDFNVQDIQANVKELFNNMYSIIIWMQIISKPV